MSAEGSRAYPAAKVTGRGGLKAGIPMHSPLQGPTSLVLTAAGKGGRTSCISVGGGEGYQGSEQGCSPSSLQLLVAERRFGPRLSDSCPWEDKLSSSQNRGPGCLSVLM